MTNMAKDGLENVVAGVGTSRDKMAHSRYTFPVILDQVTLDNMYRSSWITKRVVNSVAEDMTREWTQVMFDDADGTDRNENQLAVEQTEKDLLIVSKVQQALKWARLYGGAALIVGVRGTALEDEIDIETVQQGDIEFIHVLDRYRLIATGDVTRDLSDPNFGMPEMYMIGADTAALDAPRVHYSHVIRFEGQQLPYRQFQENGYWHDSEMQHVYDAVIRADSVSAGIASMVFEANVDVVRAEGLGDLLASKNGEAKATKRYQLAATMKSYNRMLLLDKSEEYEKKSNNFSNLDDIWMRFMQEVSGAADIPATRLLQVSPTGMSSTGDGELRNYYDMLKSKMTVQLKQQMDTLYSFLVRHTLGTMPPDFRFQFKPLWQLSATEKATVQKTNADRDKIYLDASVITEGLVAKELKESGTYPNMTTEDVALAEELASEPPPAPPGVDPLTGLPLPNNPVPPNNGNPDLPQGS